MSRYWTLLSLAAVLGFPHPSPAQSDESRNPASFAQVFVEAVNHRSLEHRTAVIHAQSRACINAQTQPYYDWIFTRQAKYVIPPDYKAEATPIAPGQALLAAGQVDYPVRPSHQLQIDFASGPYKSTSIVLMVAHDGTRWREVLPCPSADTIARAQASLAEGERLERRAAALVAGISAGERAELKALLDAGHRVEAIRRYAKVSGEDITTARSVIDLIETR